MLKIRQFLFLSLLFLPVLGNIIHSVSFCCQITEIHSSVVEASADPEDASASCSGDAECMNCCGLSHTKMLAKDFTFDCGPTIVLLSSTPFSYSFTKLSSYLPIPEKPPRV